MHVGPVLDCRRQPLLGSGGIVCSVGSFTVEVCLKRTDDEWRALWLEHEDCTYGMTSDVVISLSTEGLRKLRAAIDEVLGAEGEVVRGW
jgi:hypothetical protein